MASPKPRLTIAGPADAFVRSAGKLHPDEAGEVYFLTRSGRSGRGVTYEMTTLTESTPATGSWFAATLKSEPKALRLVERFDEAYATVRTGRRPSEAALAGMLMEVERWSDLADSIKNRALSRAIDDHLAPRLRFVLDETLPKQVKADLAKATDRVLARGGKSLTTRAALLAERAGHARESGEQLRHAVAAALAESDPTLLAKIESLYRGEDSMWAGLFAQIEADGRLNKIKQFIGERNVFKTVAYQNLIRQRIKEALKRIATMGLSPKDWEIRVVAGPFWASKSAAASGGELWDVSVIVRRRVGKDEYRAFHVVLTEAKSGEQRHALPQVSKASKRGDVFYLDDVRHVTVPPPDGGAVLHVLVSTRPPTARELRSLRPGMDLAWLRQPLTSKEMTTFGRVALEQFKAIAKGK